MKLRSSVKLTRTYKKSTTLFAQSEACKGVFVVLHGKVVLSMAADSERRVAVLSAYLGAVLGLAESIGDGPYQTTAVAATTVIAHFIPQQDVISLIQDDSTTAFRMLEILNRDLAHLYSRIKSIAGQPVHSGRVRVKNFKQILTARGHLVSSQEDRVENKESARTNSFSSHRNTRLASRRVTRSY